MANIDRIPFIPKQSCHFEAMRYCQTVSSKYDKTVSRSVFFQLMLEQPCPMGQTYIDIEDGYAYLFPYDAEKAQGFIQQHTATDTERKRWSREQKRIRDGKRSILSLDAETAEDSVSLKDTLTAPDRVDAHIEEEAEREIYAAAFAIMSDEDAALLQQFRASGFNYRELERRTGKEHSGLAKRIKRIRERLLSEVSRLKEK